MFCIFGIIVVTDTLRLPWRRFFCSFSSVVSQMTDYNSKKRKGPQFSYLVKCVCSMYWFCRLFCSMYCFCWSCWTMCFLSIVLLYVLISSIFFYVFFRRLWYSMYCLFLNVYCTTATGCQPNCSNQMYLTITHIILYRYQCEIRSLMAGDFLGLYRVNP